MAKKKVAKKPGKVASDYGVEYIAKKQGIQASSVRVALRNAKIKPNNGVYDFGSAAGADRIIAKVWPAKKETKKAA